MARKKIAQENCFFCGEFPCACTTVVSRAKLLREKHKEGRHESTGDSATATAETADQERGPGA